MESFSSGIFANGVMSALRDLIGIARVAFSHRYIKELKKKHFIQKIFKVLIKKLINPKISFFVNFVHKPT